jgi:chorismate mutase
MSEDDDEAGTDAPRPEGPTHGGEGPQEVDETLDRLRTRIREVDRELVRLVGERRGLVRRIGAVKESLGIPVLDPSQEARVVRRAAELAREEGVDEELVRDVIWRIMASARDEQEGRTRWGPPLPPDEG